MHGDVSGWCSPKFESHLGLEQGTHGVASVDRAQIVLGFHPIMSYRPVPGLVALFARGASCMTNPRAPHSKSCVAKGFSYADVVRVTMEHKNFGGSGSWGGNEQRIGGMPSGYGGWQGSMFGHGFPLVNTGFHLGHVGRAPYSGGGGGRYGGKDHPRGWAPQHHPAFGVAVGGVMAASTDRAGLTVARTGRTRRWVIMLKRHTLRRSTTSRLC
jgi:hypothetical protein